MYKVLVLDKYTKDILAPLLRLNDLRKHGITLHLVRISVPSQLRRRLSPPRLDGVPAIDLKNIEALKNMSND